MTPPPAVRAVGVGKLYRLGERAPYLRATELIERSLARLVGRARPPSDSDETFWALRDVEFEVAQGEIFGIVGRNGAGKSTLLKIVSRITEPTTGEILLRGRVGTLLEVGTGFHPELTGRENIFLNGAILGMNRREIASRLDEIVAFADVERFLETPVKHYSSGMFLRLGFAVAAHLDPEILIVDEVLAVGDMNFQRKCLGKMREVGEAGRTVLVVSHNLPLITNLCDRVMLLDGGRVRAQGAPRDVVSGYLSGTSHVAGRVRWEPPAGLASDESVRLVSASIHQEGVEGSTADVDIAKDVHVEIVYESLGDGGRLYAALWLKDGIGTPVLGTTLAPGVSATDDPWFERPRSRGVYRSTCVIPGHFLNDGTYRVTPIVGRPPSETLVLEEDALEFTVHDSGAMRSNYYGKWIGVVRPRLAWSTEPVVE